MRSSAATSTRAWSISSTRRKEPFPGEAGLQDALAELIPAGRLRATADTTAAVAEGPIS